MQSYDTVQRQRLDAGSLSIAPAIHPSTVLRAQQPLDQRAFAGLQPGSASSASARLAKDAHRASHTPLSSAYALGVKQLQRAYAVRDGDAAAAHSRFLVTCQLRLLRDMLKQPRLAGKVLDLYELCMAGDYDGCPSVVFWQQIAVLAHQYMGLSALAVKEMLTAPCQACPELPHSLIRAAYSQLPLNKTTSNGTATGYPPVNMTSAVFAATSADPAASASRPPVPSGSKRTTQQRSPNTSDAGAVVTAQPAHTTQQPVVKRSRASSGSGLSDFSSQANSAFVHPPPLSVPSSHKTESKMSRELHEDEMVAILAGTHPATGGRIRPLTDEGTRRVNAAQLLWPDVSTKDALLRLEPVWVFLGGDIIQHCWTAPELQDPVFRAKWYKQNHTKDDHLNINFFVLAIGVHYKRIDVSTAVRLAHATRRGWASEQPLYAPVVHIKQQARGCSHVSLYPQGPTSQPYQFTTLVDLELSCDEQDEAMIQLPDSPQALSQAAARAQGPVGSDPGSGLAVDVLMSDMGAGADAAPGYEDAADFLLQDEGMGGVAGDIGVGHGGTLGVNMGLGVNRGSEDATAWLMDTDRDDLYGTMQLSPGKAIGSNTASQAPQRTKQLHRAPEPAAAAASHTAAAAAAARAAPITSTAAAAAGTTSAAVGAAANAAAATATTSATAATDADADLWGELEEMTKPRDEPPAGTGPPYSNLSQGAAALDEPRGSVQGQRRAAIRGDAAPQARAAKAGPAVRRRAQPDPAAANTAAVPAPQLGQAAAMPGAVPAPQLGLAAGLGPQQAPQLGLAAGLGLQHAPQLGLAAGLGPQQAPQLGLAAGLGPQQAPQLGLAAGLGPQQAPQLGLLLAALRALQPGLAGMREPVLKAPAGAESEAAARFNDYWPLFRSRLQDLCKFLVSNKALTDMHRIQVVLPFVIPGMLDQYTLDEVKGAVVNLLDKALVDKEIFLRTRNDLATFFSRFGEWVPVAALMVSLH